LQTTELQTKAEFEYAPGSGSLPHEAVKHRTNSSHKILGRGSSDCSAGKPSGQNYREQYR
jgi:hypothetical protein